MENYSWNSPDFLITLAVGTASLCFSIYWFAAHSRWLKLRVNERRGEGYFSQFGAFYQKGIGFVLLGIIPMLVGFVFVGRSPLEYGIGEPVAWEPTLYWIFFLGAGLTIIPWYSARDEDMQAFYPQVRVSEWNMNLFVVNACIWTMYLAAYEFMFRGFLLMNLVQAMGWAPAVTITTALATITHIPKGGKETFGTIPMSLVMCLIVYQTGSIWPCIIVHSILAIANDYWAVFYHPRMQFKAGVNQRVKKPV